MIQVSYKWSEIEIKNSDGKSIYFSIDSLNVRLGDFDVTHPWEYEKGGNLLEVKEYGEVLFYKFLVDGKHLCIVTSDSFEIREEILKFFGDIDLLIITGTKQAVKVFENIEAKAVIPYGEGKEIFLNTVAFNGEEVSVYKLMADLSGDTTEFVNLA